MEFRLQIEQAVTQMVDWAITLSKPLSHFFELLERLPVVTLLLKDVLLNHDPLMLWQDSQKILPVKLPYLIEFAFGRKFPTALD